MINDDFENYNEVEGYSSHIIGAESMTIQLSIYLQFFSNELAKNILCLEIIYKKWTFVLIF